ncbi:hypothetical protein [Streptomyces sp. NPDC091371]|uniref:hypothetical protein n=1 Tax=Streptomyces sp. NPDC091371 TaxID=3155303 RepID=UPI00343C842A
MARNIDATHGLAFSSEVFLGLVAEGAERERAYRLVQAAADETWRTETPLAEALAARGVTVPTELLDPRRFLTNRNHLKSRLEELGKELQQHVEV